MIKPQTLSHQVSEINRLLRSRIGGGQDDIDRLSADALIPRLPFVLAGAYGGPAAAWAMALRAQLAPSTNAAWTLVGVNLLTLIGLFESTSAPRHIERRVNQTIKDRFEVGLQTELAFDRLQRTTYKGRVVDEH